MLNIYLCMNNETSLLWSDLPRKHNKGSCRVDTALPLSAIVYWVMHAQSEPSILGLSQFLPPSNSPWFVGSLRRGRRLASDFTECWCWREKWRKEGRGVKSENRKLETSVPAAWDWALRKVSNLPFILNFTAGAKTSVCFQKLRPQLNH